MKTRKQKGGNNNLNEISFNNISSGNLSETASLSNKNNKKNNSRKNLKNIVYDQSYTTGNINRKIFTQKQKANRVSLNIKPHNIQQLSLNNNKKRFNNLKQANLKQATFKKELKRNIGIRKIKI